MALRNIVTIGGFGEEALHKKAREIKRFDERLKTLAEDMIETMHANDGIGLAGNQVGMLKRMFVMNVEPDYERGKDLVVINPQLSDLEGEDIDFEGCLSLPQKYGRVKRASKLRLTYQDLTGEKHELEAEGLMARCIQHEYDHLDGIMFTEKMIGPLVSQQELEAQAEANRAHNKTEGRDEK